MEATSPNDGPNTTEYMNHGYFLRVQPGAVTLNGPHTTSHVEIGEGVRAYDAKALKKLKGMSARQAAMTMRLLGWQKHDESSAKSELEDDAYLAGSSSRVDQWMLGAKRWLDKAVCRVILLEGLSDRFDGLAAYAEEGSAAFLAAAGELGAMLDELEQLRGGIPPNRTKDIVPQLIDTGFRLRSAKQNLESGAAVMTTLADTHRKMKAAYYPSQTVA